MIRHNPLACHRSSSLVALAVAAGLIGCSDSTSTGGGYGGPAQGPGQTSGNGGPTGGPSMMGGSTGPSSTANPASGSSSGSTAGTSSGAKGPSTGGSSGGAPSGGSSGTPSSGGSSGSSSGGAPSGGTDAGSGASGDSGQATRYGSYAGCGQGTSCAAASDLAAPAATDGIQIATPDGSVTVMPGEEQFLCYYKNMPNTSTVNIGTFQSWMTQGSSHHFIAYQEGSGPFGGSQQADGTLTQCGFGGGTWVYATSLPGTMVEMKFPDGVGLPFAAGSQIMLNMHFINPGSAAASPVVKMNMLYVNNIQYTAASMTSFNGSINVPAATASGPGTQTVQGTCTAPVGSNFFVVTSHTHKHATLAEVNFVTGGQTINLVHTTDWEHPDARMWLAPNFLTIGQGDSFTYSCTYENDTSSAVTVGETAANNEMCMAISYYFPAGSAVCQ
jgi:hypothetical protein